MLAGLPLLDLVCGELDPALTVEHLRADGDPVAAGDVVAVIRGAAAPVLTGERTALNFLQHLGGIATLTARYVAAVAGTGCRVLDTRKTLPGYRALAKYAVRCGGGHNHRLGLYDRIMLKDNHWAAADGDVAQLVARGPPRRTPASPWRSRSTTPSSWPRPWPWRPSGSCWTTSRPRRRPRRWRGGTRPGRRPCWRPRAT